MISSTVTRAICLAAFAMVFASVAFIPGALRAQTADLDGFRETTPPQRPLAALNTTRPAPIRLTAVVDHPSGIYRNGEPVTLVVTSDRNAFITIVAV